MKTRLLLPATAEKRLICVSKEYTRYIEKNCWKTDITVTAKTEKFLTALKKMRR